MNERAIHEVGDLDEALQALAGADAAAEVILVSPPAAGAWLGPAWWHAVCDLARARSGREFTDLLDCGDASGRALEALRLGLRGLILSADAPARDTVAARCRALGAILHGCRPQPNPPGRGTQPAAAA